MEPITPQRVYELIFTLVGAHASGSPARTGSSGLYLLIHMIEGEALTPMLLAKRFTLNPAAVRASSSEATRAKAIPDRLYR